MKTRNNLLNGECTHREYYAQFVNEEVKELIINSIGLDNLDRILDPGNLSVWDSLSMSLRSIPFIFSVYKEVNDKLTLAGGVCIAKEAARQILETKTITPKN